MNDCGSVPKIIKGMHQTEKIEEENLAVEDSMAENKNTTGNFVTDVLLST
jgi:hypothetical protein